MLLIIVFRAIEVSNNSSIMLQVIQVEIKGNMCPKASTEKVHEREKTIYLFYWSIETIRFVENKYKSENKVPFRYVRNNE